MGGRGVVNAHHSAAAEHKSGSPADSVRTAAGCEFLGFTRWESDTNGTEIAGIRFSKQGRRRSADAVGVQPRCHNTEPLLDVFASWIGGGSRLHVVAVPRLGSALHVHGDVPHVACHPERDGLAVVEVGVVPVHLGQGQRLPGLALPGDGVDPLRQDRADHAGDGPRLHGRVPGGGREHGKVRLLRRARRRGRNPGLGGLGSHGPPREGGARQKGPEARPVPLRLQQYLPPRAQRGLLRNEPGRALVPRGRYRILARVCPALNGAREHDRPRRATTAVRGGECARNCSAAVRVQWRANYTRKRKSRGSARGGCRREAGFNAARTPYPSTAGSGSGVVRAGGDPARVAPRRSGGDPLPLQNRDARRAPARTTRWPDRASRRPRPRRARAVRRRRASEASREDSHRRPARAARSATRSRRSIACSRVGRQGQNAPKPKSHVTSFILNVDSPRVSVASVTQPLVASRVAAPAEKAQPLTFSGSIITYIQYEYQ
jgi:hypothetical protein